MTETFGPAACLTTFDWGADWESRGHFLCRPWFGDLRICGAEYHNEFVTSKGYLELAIGVCAKSQVHIVPEYRRITALLRHGTRHHTGMGVPFNDFKLGIQRGLVKRV